MTLEPIGEVLHRQALTRHGVEAPEDTDGAVCPRCLGMGVVQVGRYSETNSNPRVVDCECRQEEVQHTRYQRLLRSSNLGETLQQCTFQRFQVDPTDPCTPGTAGFAKRQAEDYAAEPVGWLVFRGPVGAGKTHLAAAIANWQLSQGRAVLFETVPDLLDGLRDTIGTNDDSSVDYGTALQLIRRAPLLILDDYGTEKGSAWVFEKVFQVLNHRYNHALPTVLTTNLTLDEVEPRLRSRLLSQRISRIVEITSTDARQQSNRVDRGAKRA